MTLPRPQLIIAGGGLAGCLAALALAKRRPEVDFLLLEESQKFGGHHIWSFFDSDIDDADRDLIDLVARRRWPDHDIRFPRRSRLLALGYNSIKSADLDAAVRHGVAPDRFRLGAQVSEVDERHVIVDGKRIEADAVIDARGAGPTPGLDLAWQKFVGRTYRYDRAHGVPRPVIMDALTDQRDGYRFIYSLPFDERELMIEDTYYVIDPALDRDRLGAGLDQMAAKQGKADMIAEEFGVLPIVLGGELEALWPAAAPKIARLGMRGGFFHPTTGYSLPDAVRNAALLCTQPDFASAPLHALFRKRAAQLWDERGFFRLLNKMLFRAAEPDQRYRILEHFYRLPLPLIARFYAARLTALDKLRILSGRPPVPVGRAIAALTRSAA